MPPNLLDHIRQTQQQRLNTIDGNTPLPAHEPEMLYIGCVDARLDPVQDIGIKQGEALIYRNIGALVPPPGYGASNPEAISVGATLEFFLQHIPAKKGKVKYLVVSGHTHCGGVAHACAHDHEEKKDFLLRYLSMLTSAIRSVFGKDANGKDSAKMRRLEHESVRRSVDNLMKYEVVKKAIQAGKVEIHGWVIDTATQRIEEMERGPDGEFTGRFVLMGEI